MMPDDLEQDTPQEIAEGTDEFIKYLSECDSQIVDVPWAVLMNGSLLLYDNKVKWLQS